MNLLVLIIYLYIDYRVVLLRIMFVFFFDEWFRKDVIKEYRIFYFWKIFDGEYFFFFIFLVKNESV